MSFKEKFEKLCKEKGVSPTKACIEIGLSNAAYPKWDKNTIPRNSTLKKLSEYFGCSIDYLRGSEESEQPDELNEYLEELKNRSELRMLFSLAKGATKEDVEKAVAIIKALSEHNNG